MDSDSSDDDNPLPTWYEGDSLAPYQGSKADTVQKVLEIAELTPSDVLYDLGCGDARIPIAAAKNYGCRGVGVEMFVFEKAEARLKAEIANASVSDPHRIADLVTIRKEDALTCDLSDCTVCVLYLLPEGLKELENRLERLLERNARIVTISFSLKTRKPTKVAYAGCTRVCYYTKKSEKI